MGAPWTIYIITTNELPIGDVSDGYGGALLEELEGYELLELSVTHVNPEPILESETIEFINRYKNNKNRFRMKYTIKLYPKGFPDDYSGTPGADNLQYYYFNMDKIANKRYCWINFGNYPLTTYFGNSFYWLVAFTGIKTTVNNNGTKTLEYEFESSYPL